MYMVKMEGKGRGGVGLPYLSPIIIRIRSFLFHPDFFLILKKKKKNFLSLIFLTFRLNILKKNGHRGVRFHRFLEKLSIACSKQAGPVEG
jgi:hypothetical protein